MISVEGRVIHYDARRYPDGSLSLKLPPLYDVLEPTVVWHYEGDSELFTLICIRRHYEDKEMVLYMPYCPHARMDRVKDSEDVFTLKYFCEIINSLNFKIVYIFDAHSSVAPALLDRVVNLSAEDDIRNAIFQVSKNEENLLLFFPDEGAMKRYSSMFSLPYAFGIKKRDWKTGNIEGLDIVGEEIKGKDVLIIDDICSKGGTFYRAAKALKEAGANHIYLYVSHCEDTIFRGEIFNSQWIDKVFTTDSIFPPSMQTEQIKILKD